MKRISIPIETTELCHYGCGQLAKFKNGSGNLMCSERHNSCPANRKKNGNGVKNKHEEYRAKNGKAGLYDYSCLSQDIKDKMSHKGKYSADFAYGGKGQHKKVLLNERGHKCECCGLSEWLNKPITIELEHCDGDCFNNEKGNLLLLCPNCHSQTETWKRGKSSGMNFKPNSERVSDYDLLNALYKHKNFSLALKSVGLTGKGYIYARCYKLLGEQKLSGSGEIGETQ